jgi:hypothetical protein
VDFVVITYFFNPAGVVGTVVDLYLTIQQYKFAVLDGNIMEIRTVLFVRFKLL